MKSRLVITAIFLLVLFSLKMGTGLLLHNLFHDSGKKYSSDQGKARQLDLACHCIDDFLTPLEEGSGNLPGELNFAEILLRFQNSSSPSFFHTGIHLLRGPPQFFA